jgi:hypothetical protein
VQAWLKRHPRFVLHFVPTSSSWLNLVERWFGELDAKAISRGVFRSVEDLRASIDEFLKIWNENPKPFVWTANPSRRNSLDAGKLWRGFSPDQRVHEPEREK